MTVAVAYYGGIPPHNNNLEKPMILDNFLTGVRNSGDTAIAQTSMQVVPDADVALIQGYVHEHGKTAPHLVLRRNAVEQQINNGKKALIVDSNLFLAYDNGNVNRYLRYSFNGVFPTTGFYFDTDIDPNRWAKVSSRLGIQMKPWRTSGNHILVCLQRNGGWSMRGYNSVQWANDTIATLRQLTDRPIIVRGHPGDKKTRYFPQHKDVFLSSNPSILQDLQGAWATVLYNSSPSVVSAIEGVPVFLTDPEPEHSQSHEVSNTKIKRINDPKLFDRDVWVQKLAMCHWNFEELASGEAWRHFRRYL
jgi:hypothetical protein|tara:strand:- start:1098 stop:2012 length:915 start_codon:yes stop_codon:yes gene_type:complete